MRFRARPLSVVAVAVIGLVVTLAYHPSLAYANTSVSYDFNDGDQFVNDFHVYRGSGSGGWVTNGGINNTGSLNAASSNAVFATKRTFSMGPAGATYRFSGFMESNENGGYGGMGFTSFVPSADTVNSNVSSIFRPIDALGVSVHGGGFSFHRGNDDASGSWNQNLTGTGGLYTVKASTDDGPLLTKMGGGLALLNGHRYNDGAGDIISYWYKVVLEVVRTSQTQYTLRVEVYRARSNGTVVASNGEADAIFELRNVENDTVTDAPDIRSYANFSGQRVSHFDDFQVQLSGGASVIEPGAPVVLTTSVTPEDGKVVATGSVTGDGGSEVLERGFIYSTEQNPALGDQEAETLSVDGNLGPFSATLCLPDGTHHVRAYATNTSGTSYGVNREVNVADADPSCDPPGSNNPGPNGDKTDEFADKDETVTPPPGPTLHRPDTEGKEVLPSSTSASGSASSEGLSSGHPNGFASTQLAQTGIPADRGVGLTAVAGALFVGGLAAILASTYDLVARRHTGRSLSR